MTTNGIEAIVARAEAIHRDLEFTEARRWKERNPGLAIGYMPIYVPRELLHAQGCLPVGIVGGGEDLEIIRGDAFYQSYICHIPRSTIELGLKGNLAFLDGMLFPAICDVIRNLSGMWKIAFPDKLAHYFDVPQSFEPAVGGAFYRRELEHLSQTLTARGALAYDPERLRLSIELFNTNRALVRQLYELRAEEPHRIPTSELYLILRAGLPLPIEDYNDLLAAYLGAVRAASHRKPLDQARVVLIGSFCEQPPLGLIKTLERSGCYIVDDDFLLIHRFLTGEVRSEGDPLGNLVHAFLTQAIPGPTRYAGDAPKGADLVERVRRNRAEGILFSAASFCDPALLEQPMSVRAVEAAGIPWTAFKYSENSAQFQVIREQAGTFADSIKLWSEV